MYAAYFGLQQPPFSIAPDPRYLYMSQRHREALAHLVYGLQAGGGFVLLTGEIGSGKTTICRSLLEQTPDNCQIAYIFNPKLSAVELLQSICEEFRVPLPAGEHTVKSLLGPLNTFLLQAHAAGRNSVLIIDEAQNLSADVLEQLRLLTNLETSERKLLQIILIGQPELRTLLERPELEQLAQRVIARYHLEALNATETRRYIQHRLTVAGLQGPLPFSDRALERVHALTRGVPRRINLLCDRALLGAYGLRQRQVDRRLVDIGAAEVFGASPKPGWSHRPGRAPAIGLAVLGLLAGTALAFWWTTPTDTPATAAVSQPPQQGRADVDTPTAPVTPVAQPAAPTLSVGADQPSAATTPHSAPPLASLQDDLAAAWPQLARLWGASLPAQGACEAALPLGLQCFRVNSLTLEGLRQFDRPGLVLLREGDTERWVQLLGLQGETLTLASSGQRWTWPLADLDRYWSGHFATLWRLPPGQTERVHVATATEPAGRWLHLQLRAMQAQGSLPPTADTLAARVSAFKQQHGLPADGKAMPTTFLLVNRLAGVDEPRLSAPAQ